MAPGALGDWIKWGTARLGALSGSPRLDAELLLGEVLGMGRAALAVRAGEPLQAQAALRFVALLERRRDGEPVAYLTGRRGFWSLELEVSPAVLVPRPETELLVEWALERLRGQPAPRVADLGTGSGAIALALAAERPDAQLLATDISAEALEQARRNAAALRIANVEFRLADWCAGLAGETFDLIVSNPPYVAPDDACLEALRYEPRRALVAADGGMAALAAIAQAAPAHLRGGAALLLEHGAAQGAAVREVLRDCGYAEVATRRDLAGLERASGGVRA
ncbi:MAG: peptide chain release factor N(5)-glutamine methyltransferase [Nevskia sp.]|nr:peptide chain release factor N(5)-glutamine methyltransferase [Nevskia sp.]